MLLPPTSRKNADGTEPSLTLSHTLPASFCVYSRQTAAVGSVKPTALSAAEDSIEKDLADSRCLEQQMKEL